MSEKKSDSESSDSVGPHRKGHPFFFGIFFGLTIGVIVGCALGWWFRPPSSFPIEELKQATEEKFTSARDTARSQLADFADNLAKKLRKEPNGD